VNLTNINEKRVEIKSMLHPTPYTLSTSCFMWL